MDSILVEWASQMHQLSYDLMDVSSQDDKYIGDFITLENHHHIVRDFVYYGTEKPRWSIASLKMITQS